ncbi:MFS transporter [Nocardia asiatica]|uniref:MFS transporter n=1 Tax=Nocardia asiatica TaxID=209252 RepID=UPI003EDF7A13
MMYVLIPRIGPKITVPVGMAVAVVGLLYLRQLDLHSSYPQHLLPSLLAMGIGLGMVSPSAMSLATVGVAKQDQGVASALINTMQQVGGSIGTALFSTMAASAAASYARDHAGADSAALIAAQASVHSYSAAFTWAAGFFAAGLIVTLFLYRAGRPTANPPAKKTPPQSAGEAAAPAATPQEA